MVLLCFMCAFCFGVCPGALHVVVVCTMAIEGEVYVSMIRSALMAGIHLCNDFVTQTWPLI